MKKSRDNTPRSGRRNTVRRNRRSFKRPISIVTLSKRKKTRNRRSCRKLNREKEYKIQRWRAQPHSVRMQNHEALVQAHGIAARYPLSKNLHGGSVPSAVITVATICFKNFLLHLLLMLLFSNKMESTFSMRMRSLLLKIHLTKSRVKIRSQMNFYLIPLKR